MATNGIGYRSMRLSSPGQEPDNKVDATLGSLDTIVAKPLQPHRDHHRQSNQTAAHAKASD
jgi:hypothetical protein